ncbi:GPI transamidase component Gab1p [[Candida] railenensis]|uniref:GPI transamidase component Gab1p n=1 Tax=[Candida] railenensis TaxID=45579 RepID=A0A9P0VYY8_9ASCO|nr:GPI transamidase component Gab1p [[Candida] railenensis]
MLNGIFVLGAAVRLLPPSFVPDLPSTVSSVEVATPFTSFNSLQEAFYYLQHGINLYDGGVNHHSPLLVVFLNFFNDLPYSYIVFNVLYTLIDLWIAYRLIQLNQWYFKTRSAKVGAEKSEKSERSESGESKQSAKDLTVSNLIKSPLTDKLIASFYLFNPLLILTNWSHSTLLFTHIFLVESIFQVAVEHSLSRGMLLLAVASYLNYTPIFMVIPLVSLALTVTKGDKVKVVEGVGIFIVSLGLLVLASFAMTSSWQFVESCWITIIRFDQISPNVGLWWYFFTEMFAFFHPFFVGVFNLYSVMFILPITIRFSENDSKGTKSNYLGDSFLACILCYTWLIFTKAYPTLGDLGLVLSIIPIFKTSFLSYCKFGGFTALIMSGCLLLSPIFYYCWIVLGNGNSNFFYSINLTWGIVHGLILMDLIWGKLTYDYINENGVSKELQKKLRLTQI